MAGTVMNVVDRLRSAADGAAHAEPLEQTHRCVREHRLAATAEAVALGQADRRYVVHADQAGDARPAEMPVAPGENRAERLRRVALALRVEGERPTGLRVAAA